MPTFAGFSPRPAPKLISTFKTTGPAIAISEGLDRDRAVDESGNQLAVFGRRGARPFNLKEMQQMYLLDGKLFTVTDNPTTPANEFKATTAAKEKAEPEAKPEKVEATKSISSLSPLKKMAGSTAIVGGGLGLLLVGFGWHRRRKSKKDV
jgi:hypothetical protein